METLQGFFPPWQGTLEKTFTPDNSFGWSYVYELHSSSPPHARLVGRSRCECKTGQLGGCNEWSFRVFIRNPTFSLPRPSPLSGWLTVSCALNSDNGSASLDVMEPPGNDGTPPVPTFIKTPRGKRQLKVALTGTCFFSPLRIMLSTNLFSWNKQISASANWVYLPAGECVCMCCLGSARRKKKEWGLLGRGRLGGRWHDWRQAFIANFVISGEAVYQTVSSLQGRDGVLGRGVEEKKNRMISRSS